MKLQHAPDERFQLRIRAVEEYLKLDSLEKVASSFNIHPITLRRWVKRYQEGGKKNLKRKKSYRRHPKRLPASIENRIALLKESNPSLTLFKAQNILKKDHIKISIEGIRAIWKRYNFAAFYSNDSHPGVEDKRSLEIEDGLMKAKQAIKKGNTKEAAEILNGLPTCKGQNILKKIPDSLFSLRRQVEKLEILFDKVPLRETLRKARSLRKKAENKGLFYLSVQIGIIELCAMDWTAKGSPEEFIDLVHKLQRYLSKKQKYRDNSNPTLRFSLLRLKARALIKLCKTKQAILYIKKCEIICRNHSYFSLYKNMAPLYSAIGSHKKARGWIEKCLKSNEVVDKSPFKFMLAANLSMAGEYNSARKILKRQSVKMSGFSPLVSIVNAHCFLGLGKIQDAVIFAKRALLESKEEHIINYYYSSSITLASCLLAFNKDKEAKTLTRRTISILEKFTMKREVLFSNILLGEKTSFKDKMLMPDIRLALLLRQVSKSFKIRDYRKAYNYAKFQQLMGLFHRLILFFPEPVNKLVAKGKPTGLHKTLLKLPVFQKNIPVYHLSFLGPVHVYRNNINLCRLSPMGASFLIHLFVKKKIELKSLHENYWLHSKNPKGSLSHFLYGLRKHLKLPPNTLFIKEGFLHFKGYITTDYQYYEETITRAKVLELAGEWGFAKKEYLRAFNLFRGEPFKKMYDNWSEHMRRVILNKLESEAVHFAKSYLEHKNKKDAKKVLEKISKIIPDSEEIKSMVGRFGCRSGNDL